MYFQFQIRKDNPYRKPSSDGKGQSANSNQNAGLSYDRIFSDLSASGDDELLNISAIGSNDKSAKSAKGRLPKKKQLKSKKAPPAGLDICETNMFLGGII